jgi:glycosyltransferase involved in cell wall biosynthesis
MRPDEQQVLWSILDARDETVQRMSAQLFAKEQVIQELKTAYEHAQAQIDQLESVMRQQGDELSSRKRPPGFSEAEVEISAAQLVERDKTIQALSDSCLFSAVNGSAHTNLALVKSLEEKELVIQELAKAVNQYRAAFDIFGCLLRPANRIKAAVAGIRNRLGVIVAPRLGNLNQHAPRLMRLPEHYEKVIALSDTPKVSIVTPSYGQADYIGRTIDSVLSQGYPSLEYFVQDGGSEDGTVDVLKEYSDRLSGWESAPDGGQSHAINLGFAKTSGEIMAWLNSDDILLPGALACVVDYFVRHPEVDVVYGNRLLIDENDMEIGCWILPGHDGKALSWADYVPQETLFWRRSLWERVGGKIDESFRFAMDWDLLVRFRDAGARFAHIPRFLGAFRIHEHQKTSAAINEIGHGEMDRIRERLLGKVPSRTEIGKAVTPFMLKHVSVHIVYRVKTRLRGRQ